MTIEELVLIKKNTVPLNKDVRIMASALENFAGALDMTSWFQPFVISCNIFTVPKIVCAYILVGCWVIYYLAAFL